VCLLAAAAPAALAETIDPSFLSGYVYLDSDKNGCMDPTDWAIDGAVVELLKADDPDFHRQTPTDKFGFYCFEGLESGSYTIRQVTRAGLDGADNLGKLLQVDSDTEIVPVDNYGVVGDDTFLSILIGQQGARGMWYNFGERIYPIELVSKHMLLTSTPGIQHVPEPGALQLLAVGGLAIGCLAAWRRR
jgi:hypothetical protein